MLRLKRLTAWTIIAVTVGQSFMLGDIAYARNNDPKAFVLSLQNHWGQRINQHQASVVFRTLHFFPQNFFPSLKHITVHLTKEKGPRGRANHHQVRLNKTHLLSDQELVGVLVHELAHVYDLGTMVGTKKARRTNYKSLDGSYLTKDDKSVAFYDISWRSIKRQKGTASPGSFVSGYARSMAPEDFGESFAMYVLHGPEFYARSKKNPDLREKFTFLWKEVFKGQTFDFRAKASYAKSFYDVTKQPFSVDRFLALADRFRLLAERNTRQNRTRRSKSRTRTLRQARARLRALVMR